MKYFNEKYECMPRSELEALQGERLVKQIKRVYENQPTYRAKMDAAGVKPEDIKSIKDITKLPYTLKTDIRAGYPFGMFACDKKDVVRIHASSGTTGKLTVVGYTKDDLDVWAQCCARALVMAGMDENSMVNVAYGYGLFTGGLGLHYGVEKLGATVVPVSAGNTPRQIMLMRDFQADCLCCTPSYAIYLADELKNEGVEIKDLNLKAGIFGAEPWSREMRLEIERKLGIKAYDIYGLSEISGPGVASECFEQSGSHINEDFFFPEIIDPDTLEPVPYGTQGELVFTTLTKECIPLIRYRTRDICALSVEPCSCGRTFVKMKRVEGRTDDMLIIRGVNVFPSQIESVLLSVGNEVGAHYMIIVDRVDNLDTMEIQVELAPNAFSDEVKNLEKLRNKISAGIQSNLSISAKITLVSPNSLPRSEGKAKRIIDKRKI